MGINIPITSQEMLMQAPEPRVGVMRFPISTGVQYNVELQRFIMMVRERVNNLLIPILRAEEPNYVTDQSWFDRISAAMNLIRAQFSTPQYRALTEQVARTFVGAVNSRASRTFGIDIYGNDEQLQTAIQASVFDNVRLIRTIPEQYLNQVENIVVTNARAGNRSSTIVSQLSEEFGVSQRRARFIARDQTAKVNGAVTQKRIEAAGFEMFQWVTSDDERVRDRHDDIANKITEYGPGVYRYDNPPLSDRGTPILPGVDYGCRCGQRPISRRQHERFVQQGLTRPGVKR